MPSLMIIDDEETIRQGLTLVIQRLAPHWDIIAELEDGLEALQKLEEIQPDLMIIDISMPNMDGLELIKLLFERYPYIYKIILSGHDTFAYAQKALRFGVTDYLLKPLERNELVEGLRKVESLLAERLRHAQEETKSKGLLFERTVLELLSGESIDTPEAVHEAFDEIGWDFNEMESVVIVALWNSTHGPQKALLEELLKSVEAEFYQLAQAFGFFISSHHCMLCIQGNNLPLEQLTAYCLDKLSPLKGAKDPEETQLKIGISDRIKQIDLLPDAYRQAMYMAFIKNGNPALPVDLGEVKWNERDTQLIQAIEVNDIPTAKFLLRQWISDLNNVSQNNIAISQFHFFHFLAFFLGPVLSNVRTKLSAIFQQEIPWLLVRISPPVSFVSLIKIMEQFVDRLDLQSIEQGVESRKVIEMVKENININYGDPELKLEGLSQLVFMNPNYLSALFKQVTGSNFIEYLTKIRMNAAKRLLRETNLMTSEITEQVGYTNSAYFSTLFRKHNGLTPTEYRDKAIK